MPALDSNDTYSPRSLLGSDDCGIQSPEKKSKKEKAENIHCRICTKSIPSTNRQTMSV